ncbi:MAG: GIY-YIG nuclease family protein [Bacteroidia bacterium]|nr:GIY-YIG nuclease family protein [Bacteroidia bacterium]
MFYTYILRSTSNGRHYYGQTQNLQNRLERHQTGKEKSTKNRGPWELIYYETFETRALAMHREKFFKSTAGWTWLKIQKII